MKIIRLFILINLFLFSFFSNASYNESEIQYKYKKLDIESSISYHIFRKSYLLNKKNTNKNNKAGIFSIIDFSKPSNIKRLVVIDSKRNKVLMKEYVSHGRKTGQLHSVDFSNNINSHQSSLGVYKTAETYNGKYGYSLKLDGLSNTNSNARKRFIVMHPADYSTPEFIKKNGILGRSWGCPSISPEISKTMINLIKGGTYIYAFN